MSDLVYQNYNNRCQGWTNPSSLVFGPQITTLSGYYSPAGSTTLVSINGQNFYSYSSISFGTFKPTVYFINSNILQFYVPSTLNSGTFPVQVFNGSVASNSVNYTIDNASGYWLLTDGSITNTNGQTSGVRVGSLLRGAPLTITGTTHPIIYDFNDFTADPNPNNVNWIICDSTLAITIIFPSSSDYIGREIMIKTVNTGGVQAYDNVNIKALDGTTLPITSTYGVIPFLSTTRGKWATLVYDGNGVWDIMQGN
jgi:hypothetical protein